MDVRTYIYILVMLRYVVMMGWNKYYGGPEKKCTFGIFFLNEMESIYAGTRRFS